MTRTPIDKGKTLFRTVPNPVFPSAKVPASLLSVSAQSKLSQVTTDYINPRVEIRGR